MRAFRVFLRHMTNRASGGADGCQPAIVHDQEEFAVRLAAAELSLDASFSRVFGECPDRAFRKSESRGEQRGRSRPIWIRVGGG